MQRPLQLPLAAATLLAALAAAPSHALLVDTSVGRYDVTTVTGSFNDHAALLRSQVWFGDPGLAEEFASLVGIRLGSYFDYASKPHGPTFSYLAEATAFPTLFDMQSKFFSADPANPGAVYTVFFGSTTPGFTFAVAAPVPEPAAAALLFGGLALLGLVGQARRRASGVAG